MQRIQTTYIAPLLDRLVDDTPHAGPEPVPKRTCLSEDYRRIVLRDVLKLLNTRASQADWLEGSDVPTVLDYGLPDLGGRVAGVQVDAEQLARLVARAISAFEPRLENVQVSAVPLSEILHRVALAKGERDRVYSSANPVFGTAAVTDAAGQDTAGQRFRVGLQIEARLKGVSGRMSFSFPVTFDAQSTSFSEEEKSNGKS
ncbi:type VI secretion system baseplate subunit TssE [Maridesulfovibrio zosterae]|uniref:type VI secretion system baseplate subunit TssE n=1 Tax=Maridesulfovibrio zosterae TaxID=82171 RepID=UPI00040A416D|nr:type VI secretion system baseplate subunit TssE [Maridesulfovibrio zosterae]